MTSIVVYVILFFVFTSIAVAVSSNMNYEALNQKGKIINNKNIQKLQFNLLNSAKLSDQVYNINGKIVFSNNDEYYYDLDKKEIIKNNSVIISNVEAFNLINSDEFVENSIQNKCISFEITLKKYGNEKKEKMIFSVGDNIE